MKTKKILLAALGLTTFLPVIAQDNIQKDSVPDGKEVKNRNVMLNASADNQPRQINIGLPSDRQTYVVRYRPSDGQRDRLPFGRQRAMLIDCGTVMHDLDKLVKKLTKKPVSLYLTHAHLDHAGMAINYFDKVYMNPADTVGAPEFFPDYKGKMIFLKDGQIIDLGGRKVQVVFTPAHTPGSTTYVDLKSHVGFSGDSFGNGNLLLTGTFPTLHATAQKMSDYMKAHGITKLWNGHYFGGNTKSPKRVADEVTISDDVLSGKLSPQGKTIGN